MPTLASGQRLGAYEIVALVSHFSFSPPLAIHDFGRGRRHRLRGDGAARRRDAARARLARGALPLAQGGRLSRCRSRTASRRRTRRASSIATSSRRTSSSRATAASRSSTSASPSSSTRAPLADDAADDVTVATDPGVGPRHRRLHVARAGARRARRSPLRHLRVRRGPLRDARQARFGPDRPVTFSTGRPRAAFLRLGVPLLRGFIASAFCASPPVSLTPPICLGYGSLSLLRSSPPPLGAIPSERS